jgi:shikimate dehydrogenase
MRTSTRAACVIGYPAKQSLSPKLHGHWIKRYGIDGDYRIEEIAPEGFEAFVTNLAANGYVGANVTMPHKDAAFRLSQPDEKARAIGAANTLWLDGKILRATNTDGDGFVEALDASAPGWDGRTENAVVLGAGGASRSIVYALLSRGISRIHVVNRTRAKAEAVRQSYGDSINSADWDEVPKLLANTELLVNATSLGMLGKPALDIDLSPLKDSAIVSDTVNVPLRTPLLAAAEALGLTSSNGLEMLLYQAVLGFELWFGIRPEVTREQYDLIAADI